MQNWHTNGTRNWALDGPRNFQHTLRQGRDSVELTVTDGKLVMRPILEVLYLHPGRTIPVLREKFGGVQVPYGRTFACAVPLENLEAWFATLVGRETPWPFYILSTLRDIFGNFRTQRAAETRDQLETRIRTLRAEIDTRAAELHTLQVQLLMT